MSDAQTAQPNGALSLDAAVALLSTPAEEVEKQEAQEEQEEQKPGANEAAADSAVEAGEDASDDAEAEIDLEALDIEEEPETPAAPEIPPPQSWAKDDHEAWAALTPEARAVVAKREADRDKAVSQAVQKATEASKQVQQYASQMAQFAHLGASAFEAKWQEGAKGPIRWDLALSEAQTEEDFNHITRNKALYDAEKAEVERAIKLATEQEQSAHKAFLAEESEKLPKMAPELADPKTGPARRQAVAGFLMDQGFEASDLRFLSAAELKIASLALDGLRYREAVNKARGKAKDGLKPSPTNAKPGKAIAPGAQSSTPSKGRALQGLEAKLTRSGHLDDAVSLLVAREKVRT